MENIQVKVLWWKIWCQARHLKVSGRFWYQGHPVKWLASSWSGSIFYFFYFFLIYSLCARKMPFSVKWALCIFKQITGAGRGTDPNNLTQCSGCCRMLRKNTSSQNRAHAPLLYYRFVTHIGRPLITWCLKLAGVMPMTLASSPATKQTLKTWSLLRNCCCVATHIPMYLTPAQ